MQNHLQLANSYAFLKAIFYECQRSCDSEYLYSRFVYSVTDKPVYCIDCGMFLSVEKKSKR